MQVLYEIYDETTGETKVKINYEEIGAFTGKAKVHMEDYTNRDRQIGLDIATGKADIKAMKAEIKRAKLVLDTLEGFEKECKNLKEYPVEKDNRTMRKLRRRIYEQREYIADLKELTSLIKETVTKLGEGKVH